MSKGPLMTRIQAAKKADIHAGTVNNYIQKGYLKPVILDGYEFVYYRDVLRAAWTAEQKNLNKNFRI